MGARDSQGSGVDGVEEGGIRQIDHSTEEVLVLGMLECAHARPTVVTPARHPLREGVGWGWEVG